MTCARLFRCQDSSGVALSFYVWMRYFQTEAIVVLLEIALAPLLLVAQPGDDYAAPAARL